MFFASFICRGGRQLLGFVMHLPSSSVTGSPICDTGFPNDSVGKESACNAADTRDSGSIPGSGRPPGGGHGNPLQ